MSGAPLFVHRRQKDGPPIQRNHAEALLYDLRNQGWNSSSSAIVAKTGPRDRSKMRESEREALGYNRYGQRTFEPHWPYYWNCVYPGYQNAYYPETMRCKYAKMGVTLDLWKVMVPGQMVKTDHLTNIRWFYPYDNWRRYY